MTTASAGPSRSDPDTAMRPPAAPPAAPQAVPLAPAAPADPRLVRVVLSLYPRRWRDRYGAEFASLLTDMTAASPWPARAALIADAASGALDARLNPLRGRTMPDRIRRCVATVACAVVVFVIAGAGFQKMTEYQDFRLAARDHAAIGASFNILVAAAFLAGIVVLAGALPIGWSVIRQVIAGRRADLIRPLVIAPAAVTGWLAITVIIARSFGHSRVHSAGNIATAAAIALLGAAAAAACAWAAVAIVRRADLTPRLLRREVVPMAALSVCMAVVTGADISWGLALRAADGSLFRGDNGLAATPLPPTWAGGVVVLAAVTVVTAAATVRAGRALREPAS